MTPIRFTADNTEGYSAADLDALNAEFERACMELDIDADDPDANKSLLDAVSERVLAAYDGRDDGGDRWHWITAYNTQPILAWGTDAEAEQYANILNESRVVNVYGAHQMTAGAVAAIELSARVDDALNLRDELTAREAE